MDIQISDEEYKAFIGKNAEKYIRKFKKFAEKGDKFRLTWHWPAFFFTSFWLLYRKLYIWGIIVFLLSVCGIRVGIGIGIVNIIFAIVGNYIYYRHAKSKIIKAKLAIAPGGGDLLSTLSRIGGVWKFAWVLAILLWILPIFGIIVAIFLPRICRLFLKT
jgi:hypothetical protein